MLLDEFKVQVGLRIRKPRWVLGWTQEETAEKAKLTFRHFAELERGRGNPRLETLHHLAQALDRRLAELVDVEPAKSNQVALANILAEAPPRGRKPKPGREGSGSARPAAMAAEAKAEWQRSRTRRKR